MDDNHRPTSMRASYLAAFTPVDMKPVTPNGYVLSCRYAVGMRVTGYVCFTAAVLLPPQIVLMFPLLQRTGVPARSLSQPMTWVLLLLSCLPGAWLCAARFRWWAVLAVPCYVMAMLYAMFVEAVWLAGPGAFP